MDGEERCGWTSLLRGVHVRLRRVIRVFECASMCEYVLIPEYVLVRTSLAQKSLTTTPRRGKGGFI